MAVLAFISTNWTMIIQLAAAVVQAGSAVAIVILTRSLAASTEWYAKTTDRQLAELRSAREAATVDTDRQLAELKAARESATEDTKRLVAEQEIIRQTSLQPYVHVATAGFVRDRPDGWIVTPVRLNQTLKNIGPGPALSIRTVAIHANFVFDPRLNPIDLAPCETSGPYGILAYTFSQPPSGQSPELFAGIRIEYRDIFGRLWMTTTRIGVEGLQSDLARTTDLKANPRDQDEVVEQIRSLYIRQDDLKPIGELRSNLRAGAIVDPSTADRSPS